LARPLRIDHPGGYYHITNRGVGGGRIFFDDGDRRDFLQRLAEASQRWGLVFHGYCLMTTHYHVEVETPEGNLSRAMQWVNQVYASGVNRRQRRVGHLFQGRFKSVLVEAETQLHVLTRYIHMNPVRAGIVERPADYRWSSYRAYVGLRKPQEWLDVSGTLKMFGRSRREQRRAYRKFVEEEAVAENPLKDMAFGAVLGTREFVEWAQQKLKAKPDDREVSGLTQALPRPTLEAICELVAREYKTDESVLRVKGRKRNEPRDVAIHLSREHSRRTLNEIGTYFGGVGAAAVCLTCRRMAERMKRNRRLAGKVKRLGGKVMDMV